MLLINDILISDDVFDVKFTCDLQKCKGACCWEGDYGAPLNDAEIEEIRGIIPQLMDILPKENQQVLLEKGPSEYYKEPEINGTSLMPDASCVYMLKDENGMAKCSLEFLYESGKSKFKKPISCELYPIRLIENEEIGFIAMNFDEWEICNPACTLGDKLEMPVFRFLKKAILRKFGSSFYDQLEDYYHHRQKNSG